MSTATNNWVRTEIPAGKQCLAVNEMIELIRDKWTVLVLGALRRHESLRYGEIQRVVVGISQRMLTLRLKSLEEEGLVKRTVFPAVPPRVDYELTPLGHTLMAPLKAVLDWSIENRPAIVEARRAYASSRA